ncbi:DsrE family protein [Dyadobacter sp.]|uniref:DsrE family protein n=1 Tax=Dyadobacter sp. TaxID=1914288 RepID=UPI003F707267
MKKIACLLFATLLLLSSRAWAQNKPFSPSEFHGATADKKSYKVVYQLNSDDDKTIKATLKNIMNALEDPRLKGKLKAELVVHGGGVAVFKKTNPYESQLKALQAKGVILAECENTLRERNISKDELFDFISFVPSGNGEIIIRQQQGWAVVHP